MLSREVSPEQVRRLGPVPEAMLSLGLGLLLAIVARRPQQLSSTVPGDARDPVLLSWVLAWPAHALSAGKELFDGNAFAPLDNSFAFTDALLGYLPLGLIGEGPGAALVRYNVVLLLATALAFAGTWVLVRQLGLGRAAALVAATAFAFNPWRVSQLNHLQVLSSGGIPLALAMLARGHGIGRRTVGNPIRPGWALAGWATATWQISLGFGLGLQLAYLLAVCTAVAGGRALLQARQGRGLPPRRLLLADAVGIALMLGISGLLAQPYFQAVEDHPGSRRGVSEVAYFSPAPGAFLTAPQASLLWGEHSATAREGVEGINEKALFPGLVVTVLAAAALLPGVWSRSRLLVLAGSVVVLAVLALGTSGPAGGRWGYLLLYEHAPGWQGVRTPSRLVTTAWLGLALLAAHGVVALSRAAERLAGARTHAAQAAHAAQGSATAALAVGLAALVLLEGLDTAGRTAVPAPPLRLADLPQPVMVLPSEDHVDQLVMLWSTDGFPRVVNGISGFTPGQQDDLRNAAARLPDPEGLAQLRDAGVATLVVLADELNGTRYADLDPAALTGLPGVGVQTYGRLVVLRLGGPR